MVSDSQFSILASMFGLVLIAGTLVLTVTFPAQGAYPTLALIGVSGALPFLTHRLTFRQRTALVTAGSVSALLCHISAHAIILASQ